LKYQILVLTILLSHLALQADSLLVAVLMVKNEAPVMEMTLQPLVDAGITDFLIYDTGSSDTTIQITQDFFINNNITNFVIEQGKWIDFATCRNRALELTEQHFPDATFMLMLDAEWILHNGADLLQFCKEHTDDTQSLYSIQIQTLNIAVDYSRLFRCQSKIRFIGKIHEFTNIPAQKTIDKHIYFEWNRTVYGKEKSKLRWLRDLDVLLQELQENPENARTVFYLAQTYFCLEDWTNAAKWYEHRSVMNGWDEETFIATFTLATTYGYLGNHEKMISNYLKAFALRPCRAEPLIRLAEYYYQIQSYELCYLFARHACTIAYPVHECALVEKWLYKFLRYNLLSSVAYYVQDFKLGKQATLQALKAQPDLKYLHDNLKEYESMLTENRIV
jgi:hypothetical protein